MSILKISISNFRGIPNDLILDLTSDGKKPVSLILAGDNGTGKSSITDALEFGLQGQAGKHSIGTLRSLAVDALPKVTITLNDNSAVVREMIFSSNKLRVSNTLPHSRYSISPFVLRRADILRFIETPDHQRQVLFLDYFKGALKSTVKLQDFQQSESDALQSKLEGKLRNKRNLIAKLAEVINIPQEEIPSDSIKFDAFIRGRFQEGVSSRQRGKVKNQQKPLPYNVDVIVKKIRKQSKEISALKKEIRQLSKQGRQIDTTELQAILADAGNRMTEAFHATSPRNYIDRIYLVFGEMTDVSLSIRVKLLNGRNCSPQQIFSEANLDLLALLMFISILKEAAKRGQDRLLVLDDVFQSVDASIRVAVVDYLLKEFADWQFIFTVHDKLWRNQLKEILRRHGHPFLEREITRWTFDSGPVILESSRDLEQSLVEAISRAEIFSICGQAGLMLEAICDRMSWTLPISITRRKEDKYTLGDLWPGTAKALRKTNLSIQAEKVDKGLDLRNLVGAHYNEWATSLSTAEAVAFGEAVLDLYRSVRCDKCFAWIEPKVVNSKNGYSCRCGSKLVTNV